MYDRLDLSARKRAGLGNREKTFQKRKKKRKKEDLTVSLSLGAPVHRPALSAGPELGPLRRRLAAANTESSSSQHPESSYLPLLTVLLLNLRLQVEKSVKTISGLCKETKRRMLALPLIWCVDIYIKT